MTRGSIGIQFAQSDTDQSRNALKVSGVSNGVFVVNVQPDGPSDKAGLKAGDIIVSINGKSLHNGDDLIDTVTATPIGTQVELGIIRDGKHQNIGVIVGDLSQIFADDFGGGSKPEASSSQATQVDFGMDIEPLSPGRRQELGLNNEGGVLISNVEPSFFRFGHRPHR